MSAYATADQPRRSGAPRGRSGRGAGRRDRGGLGSRDFGRGRTSAGGRDGRWCRGRGAGRGSRGCRVAAESEEPAPADDRVGRDHRGQPVHRQRGGDRHRRARGGAVVRAGRPGRRARDADARGDGERGADARFVHGVRAQFARGLGRVHDRLAVLVLLGWRRRVRGGGRGEVAAPAVARGAAVGFLAAVDAVAHRDEPGVGAVVRGDRVLVGLDQGVHHRRVPGVRRAVRARVVAGGAPVGRQHRTGRVLRQGRVRGGARRGHRRVLVLRHGDRHDRLRRVRRAVALGRQGHPGRGVAGADVLRRLGGPAGDDHALAADPQRHQSVRRGVRAVRAAGGRAGGQRGGVHRRAVGAQLRALHRFPDAFRVARAGFRARVDPGRQRPGRAVEGDPDLHRRRLRRGGDELRGSGHGVLLHRQLGRGGGAVRLRDDRALAAADATPAGAGGAGAAEVADVVVPVPDVGHARRHPRRAGHHGDHRGQQVATGAQPGEPGRDPARLRRTRAAPPTRDVINCSWWIDEVMVTPPLRVRGGRRPVSCTFRCDNRTGGPDTTRRIR